jgi:hypothetical protein
VPAGVEAVVDTVRVAVAVEPGVSGTLDGAIVAVKPAAAGDTAAVRDTEPVKPRLLTEIAEVAELPATKLFGVSAVAETV